MKTIISEIKNQIKNHESIKNSPLEEINNWKRAHYITLAEIISKKLSQSKHLEGNRIFELGNTLSYITLQRFFENSFSESAVNDLRFLKTLHKLCIFLGFYDLNEFILSSNIINNSKKNNDCSKVYCSIVKNLCLEEFEIIKLRDQFSLKVIKPLFFIILLLSIFVLGNFNANQFIYFQF